MAKRKKKVVKIPELKSNDYVWVGIFISLFWGGLIGTVTRSVSGNTITGLKTGGLVAALFLALCFMEPDPSTASDGDDSME